jgi:hypothetical protein
MCAPSTALCDCLDAAKRHPAFHSLIRKLRCEGFGRILVIVDNEDSQYCAIENETALRPGKWPGAARK